MREYEINVDNDSDFFQVARALASKERIRILKLLCQQDYAVGVIAERLRLPSSTTAQHIKVLENAHIIRTEYLPGIRGSLKKCSLRRDSVRLVLRQQSEKQQRRVRIDMPIGSYTSCRVAGSCGLAGPNGYIGSTNESGAFYLPERLEAQIIWTSAGYLEYRFPNLSIQDHAPRAMRFSCEICSETWGYDEAWQSDITLWVNEQDCGTYVSPGDFGHRRGQLNPKWWQCDGTQYGRLQTWEATDKGIFMDGACISQTTVDQLHLHTGDFITVRLGVKGNAKHQGGFNLFGEHFGDHPQALVMELDL